MVLGLQCGRFEALLEEGVGRHIVGPTKTNIIEMLRVAGLHVDIFQVFYINLRCIL